MRIISKIPDYYDYCQYTIGIDPKIVYVRNDSETPTMNAIDPTYIFTYYSIHVCGEAHICARIQTNDGDKIVYNEELVSYLTASNRTLWSELFHDSIPMKSLKFPLKTEVNDFLGSMPVVCIGHRSDYGLNVIVVTKVNSARTKSPDSHWVVNKQSFKNPLLSKMGFASVESAETIFIKISSWLSKEPNTKILERTENDYKTSHGFDKEAFRNTGNRLKR
jgi:hypothetical protein